MGLCFTSGVLAERDEGGMPTVVDEKLRILTKHINSYVSWSDDDFSGLREVQKLSEDELRRRLEVDGGIEGAALAGAARLELLHIAKTRCYQQNWLIELRAQGSWRSSLLNNRQSSASSAHQRRRTAQTWLHGLYRSDRFERLWMEMEAHASLHCAEPSLLESRRLQESYLPRRDASDPRLISLMCPIEHFRVFGTGVYCYMRYTQFMGRIFLFAALLNLPTIVNNYGGARLGSHITWVTAGTLANAEEVSAMYGVVEILTIVLLIYAYICGRQLLHDADRGCDIFDAEAAADPRSPAYNASAAHDGNCNSDNAPDVAPASAGKRGSASPFGGAGNPSFRAQQQQPQQQPAQSRSTRSVMLDGLPAEGAGTDTVLLKAYLEQFGAGQHAGAQMLH